MDERTPTWGRKWGRKLVTFAVAGLAVSGCGAVVPGTPAEAGGAPVETGRAEVERILRTTDPCGLLPETALAEAGAIAQYGSAVQLSVCAALVSRPDGELTRVELALQPTLLGVSSYAGRTEVDGVEVFRGDGPDLSGGRCQRVFRLDLGEADRPGTDPQYATVRVAGLAGEDVCDLADEILAGALREMRPGLPKRDIYEDPGAQHPCAVVDVVDGLRVLDVGDGLPTPFECRIAVDGTVGDRAASGVAEEVTVALGLRAAPANGPKSGNPEPGAEPEPIRVGDRCQWSRPTGPEIDITVDPDAVDTFTRDLGRANVVVTVHGGDCDAVRAVAAVANFVYV
ncbi:hypothetical protein G4H71_08365 [Rhodococcus triatomae]|uniref:Uncharacterized protein n=1 Tax=Rhodococcus triatomae TaxID=300028 RepID=A0A1G8IG57_9NOCA|nr:hypothetical protein [Rhodococcus triatomae]QNG21039.1 hypothetical protein G4H72_22020 [Rhodococcus triatomae]QNG23046.1 hypothetical protein G4H71_08365 [Rhodococcus triatomae]SDI17520.1 hypothetical protein SAMN05444695_105260 [Rhodococcus triatomae]